MGMEFLDTSLFLGSPKGFLVGIQKLPLNGRTTFHGFKTLFLKS